MELTTLPKITTRAKKRVGRGYGSGKGGHTVGRGSKGQKARGRISPTFEGTKIKKSWIKRLPLQRGKGKFTPHGGKPFIINLKYLNLFPKGATVDLKSLIKLGIIRTTDQNNIKVKILGEGELGIPLKVALPSSKQAAEKIKKAGGEVVETTNKQMPNKPLKK